MRGETTREQLQRAFELHAGVTLTRAWLAEHVWRGRLARDSRAIDVEVVELRRRLKGGRIETVTGAGYRFRREDA